MSTKRSVLATVLLLSPTIAQAVPKYTKGDSVIVSEQTALTKPVQKTKEQKTRPDISAQDVFGGVGEQLKAVTTAQIDVLKRLIQNTEDSDPEKPDLYFRMAELYSEQEHYFNFKARDLDQKIFEAQQGGKEALAGRLKADQTKYEASEKQWLAAAVKEYVKVTGKPDQPNEKFASYKRMDQVLFYLAFLLTQQKRDDLARPYFKRLIKDFPKSQFIADAYFAFGEFYFEGKDIEHALTFYDKVLQFPESRVFGYAKYKEGWCYFNLQDFKKALETFVDVVTTTKAKKGESNKLALVKEAKKDSVRAYAQIGTPDKAWNFFQRIGGDYAPTMMEQLGELYNAQGKFDDSSKIYHQLMKLFSSSPKLCAWQTEVLRNTLSRTGSRATPDSVKELQNLSAIYEKYKDMAGTKPTDVDECRENTAGMLRELATTWHKEAQKTNVKETYDLAQYLYKEYIHDFPKEKDIYPMTFYYGELLFKLEKYCDAAPIYSDVVKLDVDGKTHIGNSKEPTRNEAAFAAVISWKNCLNVDETGQDVQAERDKKGLDKKAEDKGKEKGKEKEVVVDVKPKELPEKTLKMIAAFDTYIKYVPKSKELANIKYTKARAYYEYNHFEEAGALFRDVVDNHRDSDLAIYSVNLLFDCENASAKFDDLEQDVKTYCVIPELTKDAAFKKQCDGIQAGIARKKIERYEQIGKYRLAADEYVKLATDHPEDPRIAEVYYNAAVDYERAKAVGAAITQRQNLIRLLPNHELSKKAVFLLGKAYHTIAAYDKAADYYEQFAKDYPGEKAPTDASMALFTASFFRRGLGDTSKAIEDANNFVKIYGARAAKGNDYEDRSAGVYYGLGQIYEEQKDWNKLEKHLQDYLKTMGTKGGIDRQIVANVKLGELKWKASCPAPNGGVNGACVEVTRVRASSATRVAEKAKKGKHKKKGLELPKQCGPETKSKVTIYDRKPALVKEAQAYFANAMKLYAGGAAIKKMPAVKDEAEKNARVDSMMYHVAEAEMLEGDLDYEKLLAMKIPDKLDFTPPDANSSPAKQKAAKKRLEDAVKKFKGWFDGKTAQLGKAQKEYQNVILLKQAHWAIAAAARIGQLFQDFSGQLYTAPVPKAPASPPGMSQEDFEQLFHDSYCDQMVDTAEPLEGKAIEGLSTCLNKSTELSWFNEWSALCEAELNQIKPGEYPLAAEMRATPGYFDKKADSAPVITELK